MMIEYNKIRRQDTGFRRSPVTNLPISLTFINSTATTGIIESMMQVYEVTSTFREPQVELGDAALRDAVVAMFKERHILYPSDISMELGVDYDRVLNVIAALENEGAVQVAR